MKAIICSLIFYMLLMGVAAWVFSHKQGEQPINQSDYISNEPYQVENSPVSTTIQKDNNE